MRKKPFLIFIIFMSIFCLSVYSQTGNKSIPAIIAQLKTFTKARIAEKAYLHFDKPYYAAGDTVYFKAYVTLGEKHVLSDLSSVLHVDLINTGNKIDQSIKLQLTDGVAWGDFALPDSLPQGNYRVRAYTQWMRNDGEGSFFERIVPVGSILKNKIPESGPFAANKMNGQPEIQFFPEGGQLVNGIRSKTAFKAIGPNGLGIAAKGVVIDDAGKEAATIETSHLGMGSFELKPEPGRYYTARITYADGSTDSKSLPSPVESGIVLKIDNQSQVKADVQLIANDRYFTENHDKNISLLVYTSGFINAVNLTLDSATKNLVILKRHLQSGVTRVTLLSANGEPLSERLLFVQNPDQLNLTLTAAKTTFQKRKKVHLNLHALTRTDSAATGHFSVAVADESMIPTDENAEHTILTDLLLTSDLKGYIEQPNYYFTNIIPETQSDLDLVMLTHGYRRFEWKILLSNKYPPVAYQPENGLEIRGGVKSPFGKPVANGTVNLISLGNGPMISSATDEKGLFRFANLSFIDTGHFMLSAVNAKNKNNTILTYFKDTPAAADTIKTLQIPVDKQMLVYLARSEKQQEELNKMGLGKRVMLKEVKIKARKFKEDNDYPSSSLSGPGHADQVMHKKEIEQIGGQLSTSLNGRLRGIEFVKPGDAGGGVPYLKALATGPMLIVVDGAEMPIGTGINILNSSDIETVEVLKYSNTAIYGVEGGNGVIVITTRQGGLDPKEIASVGVLPILPIGYYKAREFYSPKYDHPSENVNRPDLRSTIYWKPEVKTDKDGNASIDYYNADGAGTYKVIVEGIDENGNLGRQVFRYKVN